VIIAAKSGFRAAVIRRAAALSPLFSSRSPSRPGGVHAGEPAADFAQGLRYETGDGVPRDLHEARPALFAPPPATATPPAAYHLGLLFVTGRGVPRNDPVGAAWLRFAARARPQRGAGGARPSRRPRAGAASHRLRRRRARHDGGGGAAGPGTRPGGASPCR